MMDLGQFKFKNGGPTIDNADILIVDDDPSVASSIKAVLSVNGLNTHSVSGGHAALEELGNKKYELVLLDLNMPDPTNFGSASRQGDNLGIEIDMTPLNSPDLKRAKG